MKRKTFEDWPRVRHGLRCVGLLIGAAVATTSHAQDLDTKRFTLRGFGTLAATTHDGEGIEFRRSAEQARGVAKGDIELYTDSLAGLQMGVELGPHFEVVAQGVMRMQSDGDWNPRLSQGFVRYSPDEALVFRAGRIGYDIYLMAESRQVGYSYLTLRPPPDFYGMVTNDQVDGADMSVTRRAGRGLVRARVFAGRGYSDTAFADQTHTETDGKIVGATVDYLYRGWTARVALIRFSFDADPGIAPLVGALRATGMPQAESIADNLDHKICRTLGMQIGVAYDDGPLEAQLLYGMVNASSMIAPEFDKGYFLLGYRLHQWTPFASFATSRDRNAIRSAGLPDIPQLAPLEGAVRTLQESSRSTQHTASVGARYDFSEHVDIKIQLDRVSLRDSTMNFDRRVPPGGPIEFTALAASIDFVF